MAECRLQTEGLDNTLHQSSETHPQARVSEMLTDVQPLVLTGQAISPEDKRESDHKDGSAEVDPPFAHGM
jgi:hypothetical protein